MDQPNGVVEGRVLPVQNFRMILALGLTMPNGGRGGHGPQIIATSLRWASVSPSMYRWVVWTDRWPASSWTSRSKPPALCTMRAARVTNVRRPECDEQPFRPMFLNARLNQTTMLSGRSRPPRSDAMIWSDGGA